MTQVIRGFLRLLRGQGPGAAALSPAALVRGAVALCEHRFARAEVELRVSIPAAPPPSKDGPPPSKGEPPPSEGGPPLRGDARLLEHALVNLLLNACDACQPGGLVQVNAALEEDAVVFSVTDDGAGIAPAIAERTTEPFFTTKPEDQGSGLGLAVTHEIVKSHRGTLHLSPRLPAPGTVALIRLPRCQGGEPFLYRSASGLPAGAGPAKEVRS